MTGKVYLIGAGPGDPGLITVKGLRLIQQADVIVHDRLIPHELLRDARPDAELIDASKKRHDHRMEQQQINAVLVEKAQQGLLVVRLKGGDPMVFGRGGEEALACQQAGIPFEVVPGVTSAIAVPAYAGIPVTYREFATSFTVFTGHEDPHSPKSKVDYQAMAGVAKNGTLVLLMGVSHLPNIMRQLLEAGLDPATPAACIEQGTLPQQRVITGTAATIAEQVIQHDFQPPSTTVIGQVVTMQLAWWQK